MSVQNLIDVCNGISSKSPAIKTVYFNKQGEYFFNGHLRNGKFYSRLVPDEMNIKVSNAVPEFELALIFIRDEQDGWVEAEIVQQGEEGNWITQKK
jgi:hypothetical protein